MSKNVFKKEIHALLFWAESWSEKDVDNDSYGPISQRSLKTVNK